MRSSRSTCAAEVAAYRVLLCSALAIAAGCETRNPYEVSKQRQQDQPRASQAAQPAAAPTATPPALLTGATEVQPTPSAPSRAVKLDLAAARRSKTVVVRANDPLYPPRMDAIFDGDPSSLARTENVNPLVLSFEFDQPIRLAALRLYPSYSSYDWGLELSQGKEPLVVRHAPAEIWSGIELKEPIETRVVRVLMQRLERDNFVHLNEVEFWLAPPAQRSNR
jgi:hypothetical protein